MKTVRRIWIVRCSAYGLAKSYHSTLKSARDAARDHRKACFSTWTEIVEFRLVEPIK
jgi:hypothetical protein